MRQLSNVPTELASSAKLIKQLKDLDGFVYLHLKL